MLRGASESTDALGSWTLGCGGSGLPTGANWAAGTPDVGEAGDSWRVCENQADAPMPTPAIKIAIKPHRIRMVVFGRFGMSSLISVTAEHDGTETRNSFQE